MLVIERPQLDAFRQAELEKTSPSGDERNTPVDRIVQPCMENLGLSIVQVVIDRGKTEQIVQIQSNQAERADRQYININRDFVNDSQNFPKSDTNAYPEFGPSVTLRAKAPAGTALTWTATAANSNAGSLAAAKKVNLRQLAGLQDYRGPGFTAQDSGIMTVTNQAGASEWTPNVTFFFSTYGGDAFTITVTTMDGSEAHTIELVVWRKLWCDVVEMKRDAGTETFRFDDGGDSPGKLTEIQRAFASVFIEILASGAAPQTGEYQAALSDLTSEVWANDSYRPNRQYKGKKFSFMIVNSYPETQLAFLRFETFCSHSFFEIRHTGAAGELLALGFRAISSHIVPSDFYWYDTDPKELRIRFNALTDWDRRPTNQSIDIPTSICSSKDYFILPPHIQSGNKITTRPPRIYARSYFGDEITPQKLKHFDTPCSAIENGIEVDIGEFKDEPRSFAVPKFLYSQQKMQPFPKTRFFQYPIFVEIEIKTDPVNLHESSYPIGNASAGNPHVFISRGTIEQQTSSKASSGADTLQIVHDTMIRVGIHELGHALGLVPVGTPWENKRAPAHCSVEQCPMWPIDNRMQSGFHGLPLQNSCHNFLRGKILDDPFPE